MEYNPYNVLAIIFIIACLAVVLGQHLTESIRRSRRPLWVPYPGPIWESYAFPREIKPEPSAEPGDEQIDPRLEEWIAAELEKDFTPEVVTGTKEEPSRILTLNDVNTGLSEDVTIQVMWDADGNEVDHPQKATILMGTDGNGDWVEVDVSGQYPCWDRPVFH